MPDKHTLIVNMMTMNIYLALTLNLFILKISNSIKPITDKIVNIINVKHMNIIYLNIHNNTYQINVKIANKYSI